MKVIQTMTMFEQYVHGYHPEENLRLTDQANTLVELLHGDTYYPPEAGSWKPAAASALKRSLWPPTALKL